MKLLRYLVLTCIITVVVLYNAAAQTASYPKQSKFTFQVSDTLYIYFKVGKTDIVPSFMGNSATLNTFDRFLIDYTNPRFMYTLQGITLQGSASPEGKAHWNRILATRRADAISKYIRNEHSVNQQLVKKDNVTLNTGAHFSTWPELRSTRIIVDYSRISKEDPLPVLAKYLRAPAEKEVSGNSFTEQIQANEYHPSSKISAKAREEAGTATQTETVDGITAQSKRFQKKYNYIAIKTNALYDLLLTPNIGVELPINNKYSVAVNWMYAW